MLVPLAGCIKAKHLVTGAKWSGDFCYSIYDDNTAVIIAYSGHDEVIKLPSEFQGKRVIGFGMKAFDDCDDIREVYIPDSVTSLPAKLFCGCDRLEKVFIPYSVRSIGRNVIYECPAFTTILYGGTVSGWEAVNIGQSPWTDNYVLINAEIEYNKSWE